MAGKGARYFRVRRKADANQKDIVSAFGSYGVPVLDLSGCGGGVPDLAAIHKAGHVVFLEVKTAKGTLRASQKAVAEKFNVAVVRNVYEALCAVGVSPGALACGVER